MKINENSLSEIKGYARCCWNLLLPGTIERYLKVAVSPLGNLHLKRDLEEGKIIRDSLYIIASLTAIVAFGALFSLSGSFLTLMAGMGAITTVALGSAFCIWVEPIYNETKGDIHFQAALKAQEFADNTQEFAKEIWSKVAQFFA